MTTGSLLFKTGPAEEDVAHWRSPTTKWELQKTLELLFGLKVPANSVCLDHQSPLDAAWASYSAEEPVVVWLGARGLAGKTTLLAAVSMIELLDGANVNVLGGSGRQSQRVHEVERESWNRPVVLPNGTILQSPVRRYIPDEPLAWVTRTVMGNKLTALTASTKSARGPHPQRLRLDEVDEMKPEVYHAAMGQAMSAPNDLGINIESQTTLSSTQQYPDGTMALVLKMAAERNWPVFRWCHKETHVDNQGWLSDTEIDRKRNSVSTSMWLIEYELQEPTAEGRLLSAASLQLMFKPQIGRIDGDRQGAIYEFEKPRENATYSTGVDWARDQDYTVIATIRHDIRPCRVVAYERVQLEPYPQLLQRAERRLRRYPGRAAHDATGVGSVITDYLEDEWIDYKTKNRGELFADYIIAVESGRLECPLVESIHSEHKYCRYADIYGTGHPPDTMFALALAWTGVTGRVPQTVKKKIPGRIGRARRV